MYPYSQAVNPAVRLQLDAQLAFFDLMSKSLTQSFQNLCELNMQLGRSFLEESRITGRQMLAANSPVDAVSVAAETQVDLARVSQKQVQETSRTAHALADEVERVAAAETERSVRQQQEELKSARDPFESLPAQTGANGASVHAQADSDPGSASFQGTTGNTQCGQATQSVRPEQSVRQAQAGRSHQPGQEPDRDDGGKVDC